MSDNPLLQNSSLPNEAPTFDKIQVSHFLSATQEAIEEAKKNIDAIAHNEEEADFNNTIEALESASEKLGRVTSIFYNQLACNGDDDLQALAEKIGPLTSNFSSDVIMNEDLFKRIETVHEQKESLNLSSEQTTLLEDTYKDFVRGGAKLSIEDKERLREVNEKLSVLGPNFANNVSKSAEKFELILEKEEDIAGLPETALGAASHSAKEKGHDGKWMFTLDYPSFGPFIQYADNRELREKIWRAFGNRAWDDEFDNSQNIKDIVSLKHQRTSLLGYATYADYTLERRMAQTAQEVYSFLDTLKKSYKPAAQKELEELKTFAEQDLGLTDIKPWDIAYVAEKLKEKLFHFTSEDLRPYFPLEQVLKGVFKHFSKLFNMQFTPNENYPVWHEDVKAYDVHDTDSDRYLGTFYADFFPRSGKKPGAWMTSYRDQGLSSGQIKSPIIAIVCNFTKPTEDKPSLLSFGEVSTLFHEMGHAIHGLLSNVTYRSVAGTNVLWDFVELPSQQQENYCYKKETLDLFASHYETGEKIPQELIDKLNNAKNFMSAWAGLRQVSLGYLDMAWYATKEMDIENIDIIEFEDEATKDTTLFPRFAGPQSSSFSHIFAGGYSAGYYSYKWAEVLDADSFELFEEQGLYDSKTAQAYKEEILSKGGSEHPSILYKNFRGRNADPKALLRREGLLDKKSKAA